MFSRTIAALVLLLAPLALHAERAPIGPVDGHAELPRGRVARDDGVRVDGLLPNNSQIIGRILKAGE